MLQSRTFESEAKMRARTIRNDIPRTLRRAFKSLRLSSILFFTDRITVKPILGILLGIIVVSALVIALSGALNMAMTLQSRGKITAVGVGIYQDSACTVPFGELDWGTLEPGVTKYIDAYFRNEGNVPIKLSMSTTNWSPLSASSYIEFGWDYDNSVINPYDDNILEVTFYLHVSDDAQDLTEFNFSITINATEV